MIGTGLKKIDISYGIQPFDKAIPYFNNRDIKDIPKAVNKISAAAGFIINEGHKKESPEIVASYEKYIKRQRAQIFSEYKNYQEIQFYFIEHELLDKYDCDGLINIAETNAKLKSVLLEYKKRKFGTIDNKISYENKLNDKLPISELNKIWSYEKSESGLILTSYNGKDIEVFIPEYIGEDKVVAIGDNAFFAEDSVWFKTNITLSDIYKNLRKKIKAIFIPNSVTSIGNSAFCGCENLTSIVIPDSVTSIGNAAFEGCKNLTSIVIPDSVISIGDAVFYDCKNLVSVVIPNSITDIGNRVFENCKNLTGIVIPDSIKSIGDSAFCNCENLTSVVIPESVTNIGNSAFGCCYNLISIVIPNSVTSIGESVLFCCNSLTSITIPNSVTSIGDSAFYRCKNLISIVIPDSVTSVEHYAFGECDNLTTVVIPSSVKNIGDEVFYECYNLESIVIPNSMKSIGDDVFYGCYNVLVVVSKDSYAEAYAKKNGIDFKIADE